MSETTYIAYFDESGDHGMTNIDSRSSIFTLCGLVYRLDDYVNYDLASLTRLKMDLWGHDTHIFRSYDIRNRLGPFSALRTDPNFETKLLSGITKFFLESRATIISAAIDKPKHKAKYVNPYDPYELTLGFCLERLYLNFPTEQITNMVCVFESRGKNEDKLLKNWFIKICGGENALKKPLPFQCTFASKQQNLVGLQAADLAAYPISKHVENPSNMRKDWQAIEPRICRDENGSIYQYGLKIFPKKAERPST